MNIFLLLYNEVLFKPLFNLLAGLTNFLPGNSVGLSIIIVTLLVRLVLLPPSLHQARQMHGNQAKMGNLKDKLNKIKKQYKDDKTKQSQETMKLYKEEGINPASGCLPLLIQLPILIALYRVFLLGLGPETFNHLYSFVSAPENAQLVFLSLDLTSRSLLLAIIAGAAQYILMKQTTAGTQMNPSANDDTAQLMNSMQKNMAYIFPAMTVFISLQLPAALALYWVVSTLFGIVQQYMFRKHLNITSPVAV